MGKIITIDGPASSGKGTVAKIIADKLGYVYLDSGSIYRALAFITLGNKIVDLDHTSDDLNAEQIKQIMCQIDNMKLSCLNGIVLVDGMDVTNDLRGEVVGMMASNIARIAEVRIKLLDFQRNFSRGNGLVTDGRDMGSVVFPGANLKVYLTSDANIRAERRFQQLQKTNKSVKIADILADIEMRDLQDRSRKSAPLAYDESYKVLDNSNLTIEETVNQILSWLN